MKMSAGLLQRLQQVLCMMNEIKGKDITILIGESTGNSVN